MPRTSPGYRSKLMLLQATTAPVRGQIFELNFGPVRSQTPGVTSPKILVRFRTRKRQWLSIGNSVLFRVREKFLRRPRPLPQLIQEIAVVGHPRPAEVLVVDLIHEGLVLTRHGTADTEKLLDLEADVFELERLDGCEGRNAVDTLFAAGAEQKKAARHVEVRYIPARDRRRGRHVAPVHHDGVSGAGAQRAAVYIGLV